MEKNREKYEFDTVDAGEGKLAEGDEDICMDCKNVTRTMGKYKVYMGKLQLSDRMKKHVMDHWLLTFHRAVFPFSVTGDTANLFKKNKTLKENWEELDLKWETEDFSSLDRLVEATKAKDFWGCSCFKESIEIFQEDIKQRYPRYAEACKNEEKKISSNVSVVYSGHVPDVVVLLEDLLKSISLRGGNRVCEASLFIKFSK